MQLNTDFECGAGQLQQLAPTQWRLETFGDPFGYDRYFCVHVRNPSDQVQSLALSVYPDSSLGALSNFITHFPSHIWYCFDGEERWTPLRHTWENSVVFFDDHIELNFPVPPGVGLRVATNPPRSYSDLLTWCERKAADDRITLSSIGKSHEGRDIPVLHFRGGGPRLLIMAGMHSAEHCGVHAAQGIVDFLLTRITDAVRITESFEIAVIPMFNPDGNVHGYSGATAERLDINPSMDFADASPRTHENKVLWQWLSESFTPELFLHFHGYMGWQRSADFPFEGLYTLPDPPRPELHQAILDRFRFQTPAFSAHCSFTGELGETTLEHQMAKHWNTVPLLYEVNAGSVGVGEQTRRGPQVLTALAQAVLDDLPA